MCALFQARLHILNIYTSKMSCPRLDLEGLATKTEFFSGADLENLCREVNCFQIESKWVFTHGRQWKN